MASNVPLEDKKGNMERAPSQCVDAAPGEIFGEIQEDDAVAQKRLVRKLDMTLMPMVFVLYLFNYLDRNNISQAELDGFEEDLGLSGQDFNLAISILNVGYILMQIPSNMILTRVRPSVYIPLWVCTWSCISASTAACHSFSGLIGVRFVLGIAEAPFFPGVFYLMSCWYTRRELALRYAFLYSGLILATAVSGLIAAGIFAGLGGAASFCLGLFAILILPDYPASEGQRWLFTAEERQLAQARMARDAVSVESGNHSAVQGLRQAVTDIRVWIFALILCSNQSAYGFSSFYPTIVKGFNLGNRTITLVCTTPPYFVAAMCACLVAWSSDHRGERGFHIMAPVLTAVVGFIISLSVLNVSVRYFASFLYICGCFSANALLYSWSISTVNQTPEKKACAAALINVIGQLGSIWSPYFFDPNDKPRYTRAMILLMVFAILEVCLCLLMKVILRRQNQRILADCAGTARRPNLYTL